MSQRLQTGGFKLVKTDNIDEDFIKNYVENSNIGCFLKVDLKHPKQLEMSHNELLFCSLKKASTK